MYAFPALRKNISHSRVILHRQSWFSVLSGVSEDLLISTSLGHEIGGATHEELLNSLLRVNIVKSGSRVENAMRAIDRAQFTKSTSPNEIYANRPLKIGTIATISTPQQHAQVLSLLEEHLQLGSSVWDVGCGSGYLTAAMAHMVGESGKVLGTDIVPDLITFSSENIKRSISPILYSVVELALSPGNVRKVLNTVSKTGKEMYDCIHVGIAVSTKQEAEGFLPFLKPGGGLLVPIGPPGAEQKLVKMTKNANDPTVINKIDIMSVLCQDMLDRAPEPIPQNARNVSEKERKMQLEMELKSWKSTFENKHNRKPTLKDIRDDSVSKALFDEYASIPKW